MELIVIIILSYLIGTIPSALLIVKLFYGYDIRAKGTGNVGAMNSFEVTKNRYIGIMVFLMDALKGVIAVLLVKYLFSDNMFFLSLAALWVVIGHNWNIFLGLQGGRGLASATGAIVVINPLALIIWCIMWLTAYFVIKREIIAANAIALLATPIMIFSSPNALIETLNIGEITRILDYKIFISVICFIMLIKHIKPLKELYSGTWK